MVTIDSAAYREMLESLQGAAPAEAVGLLAGPIPDIATVCRPLRSARSGSRGVIADPRDQYAAELWIQRSGMCVVALYHSHPDGCVHLSERDRELSMRRRETQIVVALRDCQVLDVRAYAIVGTHVIATALSVAAPGVRSTSVARPTEAPLATFHDGSGARGSDQTMALPIL